MHKYCNTNMEGDIEEIRDIENAVVDAYDNIDNQEDLTSENFITSLLFSVQNVALIRL